MPELPEVQTTISGLQILTNKQITSIKIITHKLRYTIPKKTKYLIKNSRILRIYRIAKYILLNLDNNFSLVIHLGMSGRIKLVSSKVYKYNKHDHFILYLSNKKMLILNDQRKFGFIDIIETKKISNSKYFVRLGVDPFDKKLNFTYLCENFKYKTKSIKNLLLDQNIISGIGNIYANEILYDAKISPFIPGYKLNKSSLKKLINSIKRILNKAIKSGGTSIKNYKSVEGLLGNFQSNFKVYNREGEKIGNYKIIRAKQNGRSTFYCPDLQKK